MSTPTRTEMTPSGVAEPKKQTRKKAMSHGASGFWFVLPFLLFFVAFLVWPVFYGLYMSFTDRSLTGATGFAGFGNFTEAFGDPEMWRGIVNTLWFTVLSVVPLVGVALVMALLVNLGLPGQWIWRLSFFTPFLLMVTVVSLIWVWILQPDLGLVNYLLGGIGIEGLGWLSDEATAMPAIVLATVWWTVGFNFLLYLAALQNIPAHLYEAAAIDGAGGWRQLRSITLPLLNRTTGLIIVLTLLASLKIFDQVYLMTGGGPAGATRVALVYVYDVGFTGYRLGYTAAISYIFFALIVVIAIAQAKLFNRRES